MSKSITLAILAAFCAVSPLSAAKRKGVAYLVKDGKPIGRIFVPRVLGRATMLASNELRDYIGKMTGAKLPIDYEKPENSRLLGPGKGAIILETRIDPGKEISSDGSEDIFTISQKKNVVRISGNSDIATLYGVYQYLNNLGVEWFMPGEIGEYVPKRKNIEIVPSVKTYNPVFRTRQIDLSGSPSTHFAEKNYDSLIPEYAMWILRNRCQFCRTIHCGRRPAFNNGRENTGHCLPLILRGVDINKEPERFPLVTRNDETKRRSRGTQICFTNPKNIHAAIDMALSQFKKDPDLLTCSMSLADHGGFCECPNCVKANGGKFPPRNPNLLVWKFMNRVIKGIRKVMPHKRIAFYAAYGALSHPPKGFKVEPGIVAITANVGSNNKRIDDADNPYAAQYMKSVLMTKKAGAELGAREYTMFAGMPQSLALLDQVRIYRDLGYVYYHCESMGRDQRNFIIQWAQTQLLKNADKSPRELLEYFCSKYYGAAGANVLKTILLVDKRMSKLPHVVFGSPGIMQWVMSDEIIKKGRANLVEAGKKVSGIQAKRLELYTDTFEMYASNARFVRSGYEFMDRRNEKNLRKALSNFKNFEKFWKAHDLSATCSPNILIKARGFEKTLERIPLKAKPTARKGYGSPNDAKKLAALFNLGKPPKQIDDLFYFPPVWKFKPDIKREAKEKRWFAVDFNDSDWNELSTYNFYERQGFIGYDGGYCYRVSFKAPNFPAGKKVFMRIGSLDDEGDVYINGKLVYRRRHLHAEDWKRSFEFDVTNAMKPGKTNNVTIIGSDEYGAGGLWNPCALYTKKQ